MTTREVLTHALAVIRAEGKDIRSAIMNAADRHLETTAAQYRAYGDARDAVAKALGSPLGGITSWETRPGRTKADVEALMERAIEGIVKDIDTLAAIHRGGVLGILSAADQATAVKQLAERQDAALAEIRELHKRCECGVWHCNGCTCGALTYPCETVAILERHGLC
ncbi:hypothetical protein ACAG26_24215 [Mycobacterium sp. pUA109]|uniref:DUF6197 family protein n=1 Tax=Mycobacterium sp. pUA109 TaxID=3238982 RepID=UPI00351BAF1C